MSENKKVVSIVQSENLKNKLFLISRDELENKVKDIESFTQFINDQHIDLWWLNIDEIIEHISELDEYEAEVINSYDDVKELILKAFDKNDVFVLNQGEEGSAIFFKFQEL